MLSLSANFGNALKKSSSLEYIYLIKIARTLKADPYTASNFYLSSKAFDITDSGTFPVHAILKNSNIGITEQINIRNHTATIGGFSLTLVNNGFSDDLAIYNIFNKAIYIYLGYAGLNSLTDFLLQYEGIVKDFDYNNNEIKIRIENFGGIKDKIIPDLLSDSDAASGQGGILPAESKGKAKPIIFGDHRYYYVNDTRANMVYDQSGNLTPCVFLGLDTSGNNIWFVAGHKVDSITSGNQEIWAYDSGLSRYVEVTNYTIIQNTADGCIISVAQDVTYRDFYLPIGAISAITEYGGGNGAASVTDETQSCNLDNSDYAELKVTDSTDLDAPEASFDIDFAPYSTSGTITGINVWAKANFSSSGNTPIFDINGINAKGASGSFVQYGTITASNAGASATIDIDLDGEENVGSAEVHTGEVFMVFKSIGYTTTDRIPLFAAVKGREYSGTWGGRKVSGNLIEHPIDIVESLLRDDLALDAEINTTELDNVVTELTNWKFCCFFNERQTIKNILEQIAKQSKSFLFWDSNNKFTADTFFVSNSTNRTIALDEIMSLPKLSKTKLSDIVNDFDLRYSEESAKNELLELINRVDDRANIGSQAIYNAVMKQEIKADLIADITTAGLLADHWCKDDNDSFWSIDHNIIELETADIRGIDYWDNSTFKPLLLLELTDIIGLKASDFDSIILCNGESWSGKQFKIFSIVRNKVTLKIKAIEI